MDEVRPPLVPFLLRTHATVEDLAVITWAVPVDVLERHLPPGFEVDVRAEHRRRPAGLVSAVSYRYRDLWFRAAPFLALRAVQVHLRVHVRFRGRAGVYFLGTWVDHPLGRLPRTLWAMPWDRAEVGLRARWDGSRLVEHVVGVGEGAGRGGAALVGTDEPPHPLSHEVLHPALGWWRRTRGPLFGALEVAHPEAVGHAAEVTEAWFAPLARAGLVDLDDEPLLAVVVRSLELVVGTPPQTVVPHLWER